MIYTKKNNSVIQLPFQRFLLAQKYEFNKKEYKLKAEKLQTIFT